MPTTKTGYSALGGGGRGYINIGGWNSTLTDRATSAKEVVGTWRNEGANLYIYAAQGTNSAQPNAFVMPCTSYTYGDANIQAPLVFTQIAAAGTLNMKLPKAMCIQTCDSGTYGWYFVRGICTVQLQTNTTTLAQGDLIIVATDSHAKVKLATTTAQGYMLTAIACDVSGPAFLSLLGAWT